MQKIRINEGLKKERTLKYKSVWKSIRIKYGMPSFSSSPDPYGKRNVKRINFPRFKEKKFWMIDI